MIGASPLLGISATITMYTRLTSTLPLISISGHVVRSIRGEWSGVEGGGRGFISSLYFLVCHLQTLPLLCFVGLFCVLEISSSTEWQFL
ncbi:hypothetical protein Peur_047572 [Populus x canadensis]